MTESRENELDELWASFDELDEATFLARMDDLATKLPPAVAAFERASALDSTGHEHDAVRLYLYAYEMGMTEAIAEALAKKAHDAAKKVRLPYANIGVLLDASASMAGSSEQKLRPIATAICCSPGTR